MSYNAQLQISEQDLRTVQAATQPSGASFTPSIKLGQKGATSDGRVYVFGYNNASTAAVVGDLQSGPASVANHIGRTNVVVTAAGAYTVTVPLGATAATVNQYAQGYLAVVSATGIGTYYRVLSNPAAALSTSMVVTLVDPIVVALDATSVISLYPHETNLFVISPTSVSNPVGVPNVAVPASNWAWLQTEGICSVVADANAITRGAAIIPSTTTAGTITTALAGSSETAVPTIGYAPWAFTSSQAQLAYLTIT